MLKRKYGGLATAAIILAITGCTSISTAPGSPPASPSASSPASAAPPASGASAAPSTGATEPAATPSASKTPKPPKSAKPSTGPSIANLVITKFVSPTDPLLAGAKTNGRVTIKNEGTADAGPFDLSWGFSADDGSSFGGNVPQPVDGLAAGDSVQLTVGLNVDAGGAFTFTATADSGEVIDESNEDDNEATLHISAISEANLVWPDGAFKVAKNPNYPGYEMTFQAHNSGTEDVTDKFNVGFSFSSAETSGAFSPLECCPRGPGSEGPLVPAGGSTGTNTSGQYMFPAPGTYTVIATLDSDNVIHESNEDDNEATFQITIP